MKLIIIGKCYKHETNGPANVIRCLINGFSGLNAEIVPILLNDECSKMQFLIKVINTLLREKNCMVNVHTSGFLIPFLVWLMSNINHKNKYYLTVHGIYEIESALSGISSRKYIVLERFLYRRFSNIICVSLMLKNDIKQIFGRNRQLFVIPNGSDAESRQLFENTAINHRVVKLISLGGLKYRKGIIESLQLIAYLTKKKRLQVSLSIYGAEEKNHNKAWLDSETQKLGIDQIVQYLGAEFDKQKLYDCIAASDFQLCLSKYDTFNVAIAESLVLGCPCICTNQCGAAYLVKQNESGLAVDLSSANAFDDIYCYICSFLNDTSKRRQIYEEKAYYQKKLSWEEVCRSYLQLAEGKV